MLQRCNTLSGKTAASLNPGKKQTISQQQQLTEDQRLKYQLIMERNKQYTRQSLTQKSEPLKATVLEQTNKSQETGKQRSDPQDLIQRIQEIRQSFISVQSNISANSIEEANAQSQENIKNVTSTDIVEGHVQQPDFDAFVDDEDQFLSPQNEATDDEEVFQQVIIPQELTQQRAALSSQTLPLNIRPSHEPIEDNRESTIRNESIDNSYRNSLIDHPAKLDNASADFQNAVQNDSYIKKDSRKPSLVKKGANETIFQKYIKLKNIRPNQLAALCMKRDQSEDIKSFLKYIISAPKEEIYDQLVESEYYNYGGQFADSVRKHFLKQTGDPKILVKDFLFSGDVAQRLKALAKALNASDELEDIFALLLICF